MSVNGSSTWLNTYQSPITESLLLMRMSHGLVGVCNCACLGVHACGAVCGVVCGACCGTFCGASYTPYYMFNEATPS